MKTFIVKIQTTEEQEEAKVLDEVLRDATFGGDILAYAFKELEIPKIDEEK